MAGGAKRGRKPKPHGLKVVQGTAKDGEEAIQLPEAGDLAPPDWLRDLPVPEVAELAVREWNHLAPLLDESRVMTEGDLSQLALACQHHAEIVYDLSRGVKVTAADRAQLRTSYSEFGLTPASRTRVQPTGSKKKANAFGALKESA